MINYMHQIEGAAALYAASQNRPCININLAVEDGRLLRC